MAYAIISWYKKYHLEPSFSEQLGSRLEEESRHNPKLLQDAQLCYIVSGSFDKLVDSWSADAKMSTKNLQELVELVMFLQKSIEQQGRRVDVKGHLADLLTHYSSLLASQGNLTTALNYLGNSADPKVTSLRDRLCISVGQKPASAHLQQHQLQSRKNSMRNSFSNQQPAPFGQFNTGLPNAATSQPWQQPAQSAASQPWQQPVQPAFGQQAQLPAQPPKVFSPGPVAPPPSQPPRPGSVGSAHGKCKDVVNVEVTI